MSRRTKGNPCFNSSRCTGLRFFTTHTAIFVPDDGHKELAPRSAASAVNAVESRTGIVAGNDFTLPPNGTCVLTALYHHGLLETFQFPGQTPTTEYHISLLQNADS